MVTTWAVTTVVVYVGLDGKQMTSYSPLITVNTDVHAEAKAQEKLMAMIKGLLYQSIIHMGYEAVSLDGRKFSGRII